MARGRKRGFVMPDDVRVKIANGNVLNRLQKHFDGEVDLSPTQVQVGLALLKKFLPDLQAIELSGDEDKPVKLEVGASWLPPGRF